MITFAGGWRGDRTRRGAETRSRSKLWLAAVLVVGSISTASLSGSTPTVVAAAGQTLGTVEPARLLDTRPNGATIDGVFQGEGRLGAGEVERVRIAGRGGVPSDAGGALLNLAAVTPSSKGFATLYPCTTTPPTAASLNFGAGQNVSNATTVQLSGNGDVCVFSSAPAQYVIDVVGFVPPESDVRTVVPSRLLDTRPNGVTVDGGGRGAGPTAAGAFTKIRVTGRGGVPEGAVGVLVNLAAVTPASSGFATLYPCTANPPNAASLNFDRGRNVSNATTVKLSASGEVCVYTSARSHFALDVVGFVAAGSDLSTVNPSRFLDTRRNGRTVDGQSQGQGRVRSNRFIRTVIAGRAGVPAEASAVVVNLAAVRPDGRGFATLFPCGTLPNAASLNFGAGQNISNATTISLSDDGELCAYTSSETDFVIDVLGYVAQPGTSLESTLVLDDRCDVVDRLEVRGVEYRDAFACAMGSFSSQQEASGDFNLGTRYRSFNGFVGVLDDDAAGNVYEVVITVDGVERLRRDISLGDQVPVDLDVTGSLRLRIDVERRSGRNATSYEVAFTGRLDSGRTGSELIGSAPPGRANTSLESTLVLDDRCDVVDRLEVRGVEYRDAFACAMGSFSSQQEASGDFNLGTRYRSFNGFVGVLDDDAAGNVYEVVITVDGVERLRRDISLGDQVPVDLDVTGSLRLRIDVERRSGRNVTSYEVAFTGKLS